MADSIESTDVSGVHGLVALNPDGSAIGTPVGGATASNQTDGSQKTQIVDAGGEVATVTGGKLDVNATASLSGDSIPVSGASTAVSVQIVDGSGDQITSFGGGTQYTEGDTDASITGTAILFENNTTTSSVSTVSADNPLPVSASIDTTGLATDATDTNTATIAGDTTSIDAKTPALGQALASASVPVVLPATQITTLTPQTDALTDTQLRATPVPVSGTVTANLSATDNAVLDDIAAKLGTIDADTSALAGAVSGTEVQVDVLTMPTTTVVGTGTFAVQADTELTTGNLDSGVGTDTRAVVGLVGSASGGGEIIPGSATNGLLVNLGTNNDVTLATLPDTAGGDLAIINSNTDSLAVVGGGAEATALRVTIANDSTGVVSVDDGGGALTVDGTVTANLSATDNAVLDDIAAKLGTIDADTSSLAGTVAGTEVQVDVVGALPAGTNAIGKLAANSGVDIGDVTINNTSGSAVFVHEDQSGVVSERVSNTNGTSTAFSNFGATASTYNYIRAITVYNASATDGYVDFRDGTAGSVLWTMPLPAGGGATLALDAPIFKTSANTALAYDVSGALTTVYISVSGYRSTT